MSKATSSSAPARPRSTPAGRASLPGRTGAPASNSRRTASCGPSPSEIVQPCCSAQPCAPTGSVSERKARSIGSGAWGPSPKRGPSLHSGSTSGDGAPRAGAGGRSQPAGCQGWAGSPAAGSGAGSGAPPRPRCSGSRQPLPSPAGSTPSPGSRGPLIDGSLSWSALSSAVGVPRPPPAHGARALLPTGGRRTDNAQPGHDVPADLGPQLPQDGRGEQPQLGRPRRRLRDDEQFALAEGLRGAVRGDVRSDQRLPAAEDRADPGPLRPVLLGDQRIHQPADGLGVVGAGTG